MTTAPPPGRLRRLLPDTRAGRILALNALVSSVGSGLFLAGSILYFTTVVGLSSVQVGIGLSVAAAVGFATTVPIGRLADRFGPRRVLVVLTLWRAVGYLAYLFVTDFWQFLLVACLLYVADHGGPPINQAMVGALFDGPRRSRTMGFVRAVRNAGLTVGFAVAGLALADGSPTAFRLLFLGNAASFVVSALLILRLPEVSARVRADEEDERPPRPPARDPAYVTVTAANGVLMLHSTVLLVVLPVWITQHTTAPAWVLTALLTANTALTVLTQVPVTRFADTLAKAGPASLVSGLVLVLACLLFALTAALDSALMVGVVLGAAVVALTAGEVLHSAASWQVSFDLAPPRGQGRYIAFFHLGLSAEEIVGPAAALWLLAAAGTGSWLLLAVVFLLSGLVVHRTVRAAGARLAVESPPAPVP
ncbi:MFS transporter [Micromonospora sp. PLK6-60]|uniref:MFS transporter n=1 Tax=Micromonospora sp. PLK6-60 TaxID=2873383 RepID=UPI001CA69D69|nr:MFS transporter [Micromonospora sp. PLK6-60]MBY8870658.1 MFS transporter [Micromonospora sp. PLK6-60]